MNAIQCLGTVCALTLISTTAANADSGDACTLLSAAEVSAAIGAAVDSGQPLSPTLRQFCVFNETGKPTGLGRNAQLSILDEHRFTVGKMPIGEIQKTPESGIGDDAYWIKAKGMVYILSVKKGGHYFRIQTRTNPDMSKGNTPALDEQDRAADRKLAAGILKHY